MDWKKVGREIGSYIIALVVIIGFILVVMSLFKTEIPTGNRDLLVGVVGFIIAKAGTVVDFYFGSSKGSADKSETLASGKP